jgi:hypothetical protein
MHEALYSFSNFTEFRSAYEEQQTTKEVFLHFIGGA